MHQHKHLVRQDILKTANADHPEVAVLTVHVHPRGQALDVRQDFRNGSSDAIPDGPGDGFRLSGHNLHLHVRQVVEARRRQIRRGWSFRIVAGRSLPEGRRRQQGRPQEVGDFYGVSSV